MIAAAICTQLTSRRGFADPPRLMFFLGAAALLTALQLVPLPHLLLAQLQPTGHALRGDGAALAGTEPWQAITLDAPGTLRGLAFFVILLGIAWLGLRMTVSSRGRYRVLAIIAACCGLAAIITGVHELVGATSLYGLYEPELGLRRARALPTQPPRLLRARRDDRRRARIHARQPRGFACLVAVVSHARSRQSRRARAVHLALITGAFVTGASDREQSRRRAAAKAGIATIPIDVVAISTIRPCTRAPVRSRSSRAPRSTRCEPASKSPSGRGGRAHRVIAMGRRRRGAFETSITHDHPAQR